MDDRPLVITKSWKSRRKKSCDRVAMEHTRMKREVDEWRGAPHNAALPLFIGPISRHFWQVSHTHTLPLVGHTNSFHLEGAEKQKKIERKKKKKNDTTTTTAQITRLKWQANSRQRERKRWNLMMAYSIKLDPIDVVGTHNAQQSIKSADSALLQALLGPINCANYFSLITTLITLSTLKRKRRRKGNDHQETLVFSSEEQLNSNAFRQFIFAKVDQVGRLASSLALCFPYVRVLGVHHTMVTLPQPGLTFERFSFFLSPLGKEIECAHTVTSPPFLRTFAVALSLGSGPIEATTNLANWEDLKKAMSLCHMCVLSRLSLTVARMFLSLFPLSLDGEVSLRVAFVRVGKKKKKKKKYLWRST